MIKRLSRLMNVSGAHPSSPKFKTVTFCSNVDAGPDVITFYTYPETTPMDAKRHSELSSLFAGSKAALIYVTAFPDRQTMGRYLSEISWETEVWVAEAPTHMIHFDGDKFLGPYEIPLS